TNSVRILNETIVNLQDEVIFSFEGRNFRQSEEKELAAIIYNRFAINKLNQLKKEYSLEQNLEVKLEKGETIIGYLMDLKKLPEFILAIYQRRDSLDEVYTELVFDPYTYNPEFRKRKKKRLYDKAAVEAHNCLIQLALKEEDFEKTNQHLSKIYSLQHKLFYLANQNTRKSENKLKYSASYLTTLELLEL